MQHDTSRNTLPDQPAVPVLSGERDLTSRVWCEIQCDGRRITCPAGTFIDISGAHTLDIVCLESGAVRIVFDTLEGRHRALMTFDPGSIFNLACALARRNASGQYQCLEDSVLWRVPGDNLQDAAGVLTCPHLSPCALRQMDTVAPRTAPFSRTCSWTTLSSALSAALSPCPPPPAWV